MVGAMSLCAAEIEIASRIDEFEEAVTKPLSEGDYIEAMTEIVLTGNSAEICVDAINKEDSASLGRIIESLVQAQHVRSLKEAFGVK